MASPKISAVRQTPFAAPANIEPLDQSTPDEQNSQPVSRSDEYLERSSRASAGTELKPALTVLAPLQISSPEATDASLGWSTKQAGEPDHSATSSAVETASTPTESTALDSKTLTRWMSSVLRNGTFLEDDTFYSHFQELGRERSIRIFQEWFVSDYDLKNNRPTMDWVRDTVLSLDTLSAGHLYPLFADPALIQNFDKFYKFLENSGDLSKASPATVRQSYLDSLPSITLYRGMVLEPEQVAVIGNSQQPGVGILSPMSHRLSNAQSGQDGLGRDLENRETVDFLWRWFGSMTQYPEELKTWGKPLGPVAEAESRVRGGFPGFLTSFTRHPEIAESVGYWASGQIDLGTSREYGTRLPTNPSSKLVIYELSYPDHVITNTGPYFSRAARKNPSELVLYKTRADGQTDLRAFDAAGEHRASYELFLPFVAPARYIKNVDVRDVSRLEDLPPRFVWETNPRGRHP
jgi:hypothetical protein